ncbi:lipid droplet-associated perilipin protein [Trametes versicolor FP-101664 SS1]|uniref:lipid droplet-associated perilipin protein n=1 Tax=Trametes versicolor (strain FP-101664) TaxID=717944 RepID=UPI00046217F4|nr:lipid droplet-associated perilipin protein [Trametes versicolor FP-101664 SS1]EIW54800.1 lipid droplet-associated perilipin protein [Trametes versicolor FP-101664 SS1]
MATETHEATPAQPELTILSRVGSIPLVADSLSTIHSTLTNNAYTRSPYATAQGLTQSALSYTEPIQKRLAPILTKADGLANKGLDAVESRYPYPFQTPTEDIIKDLKGHSDHAKDVANKTLDDKVRTPAYQVAQGIDQRFAPIVDYFAVAVNKFHSNGTEDKPTESPEAQFQYQRAYFLTKDLRDQLYTYSTEQINQIKTQSVLVQRASATASSLSELASSSYGAAQSRVHSLSDTMVAELQKVQASTAALPATLQASFHDVSANLTSTINELSAILTSPEPVPEKVQKVRDTVQQRVQPILDTATARVQEVLGALKARVSEEKAELHQSATTTSGATTVNGVTNGNGHA